MRIKEFAIWKYGPLAGAGKMELGDLNLFFGPNEQGKTLMIDALVKMLLPKGYREFEGKIDRVDELPEGYVILEKEGGREIKLPEAGNLTRVTGLSATECRNIFIVRDSDLSISRENEFYKGVTNRLTGLRTEEIERIKTSIRELARLTPGLAFLDISPDKLKSKLGRARKLVEQIRGLKRSLAAEGYDRFETELAHINHRVATGEQALEAYEEARRREIYQKGRNALQAMRRARQELAALQEFNREELDRWQALQAKIESLQAEEAGTRGEMGLAERELQRARQLVEQLLIAVQGQEQIAALFSEQVELKLKDYIDREREWAGREGLGKNLFTTRAALYAGMLLLVSLAGAVIRPAWWFYPPLAAGFLFILIFSGFRVGLARNRGRLASLWRAIYSQAAGLGAVADNSGELLAWWGDYKRKLAAKKEQLSRAKSRVALQEQLVERFQERLAQLGGQVAETYARLRQLRQKTALDTPAEYRQKLKMKLAQENRVQQQEAVLESHFGSPKGISLSEQVAGWENSLAKLEAYAGLSPEITYSEQKMSELQGSLQKLRQRQEELTEKWNRYRELLLTVEKEINKNLGDEDAPIYCQTLADLEAADRYLTGWIEEQEANRRWATIAIKIFDRIAAEEELKVLELFGEQSPVSRYFSEITDGRYRQVLFDTGQREIMVVPNGRSALPAARLSGGAYDQLYFSIRIALGKKLLAGETGFFILDDPFIKADPGRLRVLLKMLLRVADSGWQVLYFSAKGEVKGALQEELSTGRVKGFDLTDRGPGGKSEADASEGGEEKPGLNYFGANRMEKEVKPCI